MRANLSKEVTDRFRSCLYVFSVLLLEGPSVAAVALDLVRPSLLDGDPEPDFLSQIVAMGRRMKAAVELLVETDLALRGALARLGVLRRRRDDMSDEAGLMIVGLRRITSGHHADPDLEGLALHPLTHRDSITVLRRSEAIFQAFDGPDSEALLGKCLFKCHLNVHDHAAELRETVSGIQGVVEEVHKTEGLVNRLREKKLKEIDDYDGFFLRTSRMFEDLCHFADRPKLAAKVRPSKARPGRTDEDPPPLPEDGEDDAASAVEPSPVRPQEADEAPAGADAPVTQ